MGGALAGSEATAAASAASAGAASAGAASASATNRRRVRPLWAHSPPFRDSACGDSVDSERGSVGSGVTSASTPTPTTPAAAAAATHVAASSSVDEGVDTHRLGRWESTESPLGSASSQGSAGGGIFHVGRRASDSRVNPNHHHHHNKNNNNSSSGGGGVATPLADTNREHRALCLQFAARPAGAADEPKGESLVLKMAEILKVPSHQLDVEPSRRVPFDPVISASGGFHRVFIAFIGCCGCCCCCCC